MALIPLQSKSTSSTSSTTTLAATLTSTPVTGNVVLLAISVSTQSAVDSITTVKDSNAVSLTRFGSVIGTGTGFFQTALYGYAVPATPSTTFTITFTVGQQDKCALAEEWAGYPVHTPGLTVTSSLPVADGSAATSSDDGSVTLTYTAPTYTAGVSGDVLLGVLGDNGGPATWAVHTGQSEAWVLDAHVVNGASTSDILTAYGTSVGGTASAPYASPATGTAPGWGSLLVAFAVTASAFVAPRPRVVGQALTRSTNW